MKLINIFLLAFLLFPNTDPENWSEKLKQKIDTVVLSTYQTDAYSLIPITVGNDVESNLKSKMNGHLYKVQKTEQDVGYIYVNQAPSMKNVFDYIVLFTPDLKIKNTKVLIYREQHGRQIGSKRWLSQFFGMGTQDRPTLGEEVDGISGATISCTSMTKAVDKLLASMQALEQNGTLN